MLPAPLASRRFLGRRALISSRSSYFAAFSLRHATSLLSLILKALSGMTSPAFPLYTMAREALRYLSCVTVAHTTRLPQTRE